MSYESHNQILIILLIFLDVVFGSKTAFKTV